MTVPSNLATPTNIGKATLSDMAIITQTIEQVCAEQQITCLHSIESGSRAWGFASPDSDYDVRLIYCQAPEWYFSLFEGKDTFEFIKEDLLAVPFDIGGWDIKKALQLIYKSNAVIFEWLHSPIVYQQQTDALVTLKALSSAYFQPIAVLHHYRGMAKTASTGLELNAPVKIKKLFYLLRALLAANWTITQQTPPPVIMAEMFGLINADAQYEITQLIALKSHCAEGYKVSVSPLLIQTIGELWQSIESAELTPLDTPNTDSLNDFFRQVVLNQQPLSS
jgi:hypothetical protein